MAPTNQADQCQASRKLKGSDFWKTGAPKHRTRTELNAARAGVVDAIAKAEELGTAGRESKDAPLAPAHKIDNNTNVRPPLSSAAVKAGSRNELLRSRKEKGAVEEQQRYNKWADANPRQPPHPAHNDGWVAEPAHATFSEIQAEKRTKSRQSMAPFEEKRPKGLAPEPHDPKFDDQARPKTASIKYVPEPQQRTKSSMQKARAADNLRNHERSAQAAKRSAQQRREQQHARTELKQQANSKSLSQLRKTRKQARTDYEREMHTSALAEKEQNRPAAWKDAESTGRAYWQSEGTWVPDPAHTSRAELFVSQRSHLPNEQFNTYSDPPSDPFKREFHRRKQPATDDDLICNVAKMLPHSNAVYASKLGKIKGRDSSFTDYQLYFTICDKLPPRSGDAPSDNDPLFSSFTKDKVFDSNTGLPPGSVWRRGDPPKPAEEVYEVEGEEGDEDSDMLDEIEPASFSPDGCPMPAGTCWVPAPEVNEGVSKTHRLEPSDLIDDGGGDISSPGNTRTMSYTSDNNQFNSNVRIRPGTVNGDRRGVKKPNCVRPKTAVESKRSFGGSPSLPPGHLWKMKTQERRPGTAQVRSSGFQNLVANR